MVLEYMLHHTQKDMHEINKRIDHSFTQRDKVSTFICGVCSLSPFNVVVKDVV
jgi:hypothetical protein